MYQGKRLEEERRAASSDSAQGVVGGLRGLYNPEPRTEPEQRRTWELRRAAWEEPFQA